MICKLTNVKENMLLRRIKLSWRIKNAKNVFLLIKNIIFVSETILYQMKHISFRKKMIRLTVITSVITSLILFLFVCVFLFWIKPFKILPYYVVKDEGIEEIMNKKDINKKDFLYMKSYLGQDFKGIINSIGKLSNSGVIISPEQYASNMSSYYNTLIAVLSFLLVILNVIAFFSLKTNAELDLKYRINNLECETNDKMAKLVEAKLLDSETVHNKIQALLVSWLNENEINNEDSSNNEDVDKKFDLIEERLVKLEQLLNHKLSLGTVTV